MRATKPRSHHNVRMDEHLLREITTGNRLGSGDWRAEFLARAGASSGTIAAKTASFAITVGVALLVSLPLIYLSGADGDLALEALVVGSWGSPAAIAETLVQSTPLLISGLAVALAFHAGLFNIGVEGQLVVGALAAGIIGATLPLPGTALLVVCMLGGAAAGALWALVPALLKAFRGVHEVVTTIMMNYVAFSLSTFLVSPSGPFVSETQPSATEKIIDEARLPVVMPGTRLHAGLIIAIILVVAFAWVLHRTPFGFGLRLTGANRSAAESAGVSVAGTVVRAMLLSGGLAGIAGAVQVLGLFGRYYDAFSPGYGFDAIAVALLGALAPIGIAVAALFFGTLDSGAVYLQAQAGMSREMVGVISGLVVAFVAAQPAVLRLLRAWRARRPARGGELDHAIDTALPPPLADENEEMSRSLAEMESNR
ncbi:ABC transporter permease [Microbacterium thalassium]|uniref:Simple sugar transport system permease protein n=1 Tax=Microbacterium thalassium TaxID=362649 RepID=A0A7X0FN70_9MICO|nr:ABC transporter permease [Microbacterium thalassium]MBB6390546.1 simple sugar transport system permease protein [Microbacterium thalassium]GLK25657.1 ABC transporter permease [Microbacterium thalassium]